MKKIDEREIATDILMDIIREEGYNNIVLRNTLKKYPDISTIQKNFITELVNGTLRNVILLDYIIDWFSKTSTDKMKQYILAVLRISVYQIKFMDKVPSSAICNSAVNLVKARGFNGLAGFVNGVLRNIVRKIDEVEFPDEKNEVEYLSVMYSYPKWIVKYWLSTYSYDVVKAICIENNIAPKVTACVNNLRSNRVDLAYRLKEENVKVTFDEELDNVVYLSNTSNLIYLDAFKKGLFHIMDKSSIKSIDILNPKSGEEILDMCSAPGGKSFYSAYKMENKGKILSCDIYDHKIELIESSANRLDIGIIETVINDGVVFNENFIDKFDKVILDAPCSCLGLIKKKPDIKHTKSFEDVKELVKTQRKLLANAKDYVKINGSLIYSTCTISQRENIGNINWFLDNFNNYQLEETYQYLPGVDGVESDGFFIALLRRRG